MINLLIDRRDVRVEEGATLLDAANQLELDIPILCHLPGEREFASCMVCVVEDRQSGRLLPACSTRAADGMRIATSSDEVVTARRQALELLLSEHLGDCEGPCRKICPADMDIPTMIRQIEEGDFHAALVTVKERIALPAVLGRICPAPCEKGCRRVQLDTTVAICELKRVVADADLAQDKPYLPPCAEASGKRVAIVGAGPAGLAAAYYLAQQGHHCTIFDAHPEPGGMLRYGVGEEKLPRQVLDAEIAVIRALGVELRMGTRIGDDVPFADLREEHDAVVLAPGSVVGEALAGFGVEVAKGNAKVDGTFATSLPGVFAGGGAVRPGRLAVRSVAHGWAMARAVGQFLRGEPLTRPDARLNSSLGKLRAEELQEMLRWTNQLRSQTSSPPPLGTGERLDDKRAVTEAARCLRCSCQAGETCDLRRYAEEYGADPRRFRSEERPSIELVAHHDLVTYEPGKCIRCGRCVRITERQGERLGLSFVGRGFDVRVAVPLGETLDKGLEKAAEECALSCPTGALELRRRLRD